MQQPISVDFHVIEPASSQQAHRYACQLIEKAYQAGQQPIYVHTDTRADAERFDTLLWTYRDDSFLPHELHSATQSQAARIQIGYADNMPNYTPENSCILINLSKDLPSNHQTFAAIIEIVFSDPAVQQLARERFKQYRQYGYSLNTHKLKAYD